MNAFNSLISSKMERSTPRQPLIQRLRLYAAVSLSCSLAFIAVAAIGNFPREAATTAILLLALGAFSFPRLARAWRAFTRPAVTAYAKGGRSAEAVLSVKQSLAERELSFALRSNELTVFYVPIVELSTGRLHSFETQVRWFHPERGSIATDVILDLATKFEMIGDLEISILLEAAEFASDWPDDITLAVDFSPKHLAARDTASLILNILDFVGLPPSQLELEVHEAQLGSGRDIAKNSMTELASAGVRFTLDHFESGFASVDLLRERQFSKIKLDRRFAYDIENNENMEMIAQTFAELGTALDLQIVADGIESSQQVEALSAAGITLGQGYYFGRPVSKEQARLLIAKQVGHEEISHLKSIHRD